MKKLIKYFVYFNMFYYWILTCILMFKAENCRYEYLQVATLLTIAAAIVSIGNENNKNDKENNKNK